ncbi:hypothetical protein [Bacillus cereus]|uniref:hypothetical protein n=1 Tax=Bacillus cereus TaxID=1396 RepID=UPI001155D46A|nr:hypothetical protein [Bacillus cereus]
MWLVVIGEVVVNLFDIRKKYALIMHDEDGVLMDCKCTVVAKSNESLQLDIFEKNGNTHHEKVWVEWRDLEGYMEL